MYHHYLLLCLSLGTLVKYAAGNEWCYHGCEKSPDHWRDLPGSFCGGQRQSPINIATSHVQIDPNLLNFTFINFSSQHAFKTIVNNGHTVKLTLKENEVEVSGGGLNGTYSTIQFHFHWGDTEHHPGSEHMIDWDRYPMEMHIVSLKKGLNVEEATAESEGIAVLGFFINATEDDLSEPWRNLASYLTNVKDTEMTINHSISLDDLIGDVDRTKFYRYMGSLTTPSCNEAVVWTVFHEPISVPKSLIQQFPAKTEFANVYRPPQDLKDREVFASPGTPLSGPWCYDEHHCSYNPSQWGSLPHSHCSGEHQSPINIETQNVVMDEHLDALTFTKFDDKHAIKYITNTGHSVKCVLKEDMVEVSGGGLGHVYSTLQFHFHWGLQDSDGSEHTVDSKRYPMEIHIVSKRKDLPLDEAIRTSNGLAVLGFFIEAADSTKSSSSSSSSEHEVTNPTSSPTSDTGAWKKMTSYLSAIQNISSEVEFKGDFSIDDLLGNVNRAAYYRYNGSLTTPLCNEAVVWTVFKESIKVDQNLVRANGKLFHN
ncbi:receptor-type tyrosine-protein phosphatase gamma-like isoform X2 [Toxotes jaculatrix]|uniref:receptor-type tyrosine-protein phosphatase gamma-like isoform X2 n=1 Tax=Toxotes jaculatrix TaxID=941984 RepID=UPI001B3AEE40|nr:receptor-type tyrosine-protein phosphatase gamma-like isoform X2 [Toxotes jaculatrix]